MSQGSQAKMLWNASTDFSSGSEAYCFLSENLIAKRETIRPEGMHGSRSKFATRSAPGLTRVGGSISIRPTPVELDAILPRILGAAESTDSFALAETLPSFSVLVDRDTDEHYQYDGCKIGKGAFSSSEGQPLVLATDILGKTVDLTETTFPTVAPDTGVYYTMSQGVLTLAGTTHYMNSCEIVIDNLLEAYFDNSITAHDIDATDRLITLSCDVDLTSASKNQKDSEDGSVASIAGSIVFTNGNQSLTFTFPALVPVDSSDPSVGGKGRIMNPFTYEAYKTPSAAELTITNDSTA